MKNEYKNCPFCDGKLIQTCKCLNHNGVCENGHESWFCYQHKHYVLGEFKHEGGNTCEGKKTKEV